MYLRREAELTGPSVLTRSGIYGLEMLSLVFEDSRIRKATGFRMIGKAAGEQRSSTPMKATDETERVDFCL